MSKIDRGGKPAKEKSPVGIYQRGFVVEDYKIKNALCLEGKVHYRLCHH